MLGRPTTARRTGAAIVLVLAPLLLLIGDLISPAWDEDTTTYVSEVAEHPVAQGWSGVLIVVGFALMVPAVIAIVHLIKGRGVTLAHIGGGLAILGLGAFPALAMTAVIDSVAVETISRADYVKMMEAFEDKASAIVLLVLILVPALVSLICVGAALWRSGLTPWWVAVGLIVVAVLFAAGGSSQVINLASNVVLLAVFAFIARRMLSMSDWEWENPPERWAGGRSGSAVEAEPGLRA